MSNRTNQKILRMTGAELLLLEEGAELAGRPLARWIREAALAAAVEECVRPVRAAASLEALCAALNAYQDRQRRLVGLEDGAELEEVLRGRLELLQGRLPTYGGERIEGALSWDAESVLLQEGALWVTAPRE